MLWYVCWVRQIEVASWLFLCNWMKERITCACAGGHINTSFQCLNTNLWGAGAGALLGLWDREPSGSLSLEFGAMMRDRISENSKKLVLNGGTSFQLQDIFPRIGFLQVCSLLMRLLSAGPSGECALPFFFARDLEKRGSTCSFALCWDVVARVPSTFWFWVWGNDWEDHTLHVCGNVEWFVRNIFVLFGLVIEWNVTSEVAAWSEIASPIFLRVLIRQQKI